MKTLFQKKTIPFWICLVCSISLLVGGFFAPPMGVIDGSILTGVGILFAFAVLGHIPIIIELAGYAKITKGDTTIEISKDDEDE